VIQDRNAGECDGGSCGGQGLQKFSAVVVQVRPFAWSRAISGCGVRVAGALEHVNDVTIEYNSRAVAQNRKVETDSQTACARMNYGRR